MKVALFVAVLGSMVMAGNNAKAQTIFADDFGSGDARAWDTVHPSAIVSYHSDALNPPGKTHYASFTLTGGKDQQSPYFSKEFTHSGPTIYFSGWWRFPVGYTWNGAPTAPNNFHHKLLILDTADNLGRLVLNLSDAGLTPQFRLEVESPLPANSVATPSVSSWTEYRYPADGLWHHVELEVQRAVGVGAGRARIWIDGDSVMDKTGTVCNATCSPIVRAKYGAYVNQGADVTKTFSVGPFMVSGSTRDQVIASQTPPAPPAPTRGERINLALTAYANALDQLALVAEQLDELKKLETK